MIEAWLAAAALLALLLTNGWWWRRYRRLARDAEQAGERRRREERHLREELARDRAGQEAVFDCMTDGLVVLDARGRIGILNPPVRRLFGLSGDPRGRTLLEALRRHELDELAGSARRQGQALDLELETGGHPNHFLQVNATTFEERGGAGRGVILVFHDVTRLRHLESLRREFVANVSHELRTPLSLIKGYVETLIDGARHDPDVGLRFLRTIEKHTDRLTFLIEDLLTISRLEGGQIVMKRDWGDLAPLAARVLEDFADRAAARGTRLVNRIPGNLRLRADFDRLHQVLANLVDNAIKYGRTGGEVTLEAGPDPDLARVRIEVADDGPGIPAESLGRVFERFYRVDTARSREEGGTGLGLSIVKHIVQAHGGEVGVESRPGAGTRFRLVLPIDPAASPPQNSV